MWHLDAAATLVSFSGISFEGSFFFFFFWGGGRVKIVYWIFHTALHQRHFRSIGEISRDGQVYTDKYNQKHEMP